MTKTLVLIRHAHRDNTVRALDNGLSEKGREQARQVKRFFTDRFQNEDFKKGLWLVSSPKLRCVETLQPLAKTLSRSVDVHPGLVEQGVREGRPAFEARVQSFLQEWESSQLPLAVACSHGDWLPVAVHLLLGVATEMKKGAWLEIDSDGGVAALRWYIPSFKHFYR